MIGTHTLTSLQNLEPYTGFRSADMLSIRHFYLISDPERQPEPHGSAKMTWVDLDGFIPLSPYQ